MSLSVRKRLFELVVALLKLGVRLTAGKAAMNQIYARLAQELTPVVVQDVGIGKLHFYCPGPLPEYRARTLLVKEPETIEWINSFAKDDVMWDVGANVGIYSVYAGLRGCFVLSFEPAAGNNFLLARNIELNKLDDRIRSYCIAFSDNTKLDVLHMSITDLGGSMNTFGEATDWKGESYSAVFQQAAVGFTIDDFVSTFKPRFPNHLKIDVDGIEKKIIIGAKSTLSDLRLKSVLVELNTEWSDYNEILGLFETAGMKLALKSHAPMFDHTELKAVFNHVFMR